MILTIQPAGAQSSFVDGTFTLSNWSKTDFGPGTSTMAQQASGGNPGSFLQVSNSVNAGLLEAVHLLNTGQYNPATSGGFSRVSFSVDTMNLTFSQSIQPVLFQNGVYWFATGHASTGSGTWTTLQFTNLQASDFIVNPFQTATGPLDFSATGSPISFGFAGANSDFFATSVVGVDNFSVTLGAIPEPSAYAAFFGAAVLAVAVRRKKKSSG